MAQQIITGGNLAAQKKNAELQKTKSNKACLNAYLDKMQGEIKKALPSVITPERFTRIALTAVSNNPALAEDPKSFIGAMMQAAQLGLEVNSPLGLAYIIPYKDGKSGISQCQFQMGYKGLIDLAYRSGDVTIIQAHEVCENDEFRYSFGLEPDLVHKPAVRDRGEVIAYYAMFKTKSGGYGFEVMSREDIEAHAKKFSKAYGNGPWQSNFDEMAKKTVLKKALKYAPMKSDFVRGLSADETVKNEIAEDMTEVTPADIEIDAETGEVIVNNAEEVK